MDNPLAAGVVLGYLVVALAVGVAAGRVGKGGVDDFVAGERAFGPVVMYFVLGATIFSAYALLGTPQRVAARGSDAFYILAYGSVGLVPMFFFGGRVRTIGAAEGFVTQAELLAARFQSRRISLWMGLFTVLSFVPYMVIQLKGAGLVMQQVFGWEPQLGAFVVYGVVLTYVVIGGVRGVGWTNVLQGIVMLVVVWTLGLWIPHALFGGVTEMFDRVVAEAPEYLTLPGPDSHPTGLWKYSSEILVSALGFCMFPQVFMKAFTAKSARLVQLSVVLYPTFLLFLVPLLFVGYAAVLIGGPIDDSVLVWMVQRPEVADAGGVLFAAVAFAVLAASMSTGDALLHAAGSIWVRDVMVGGFKRPLSDRQQTRWMRWTMVVLAGVGLWTLEGSAGVSVVDLLLLTFAVPIQFMPLTLAALYSRRANRAAAEAGLGAGLGVCVLLFVAKLWAPTLYAALNPLDLQIGVLGGACNVVALAVVARLSSPMAASHLARFGLAPRQ